MSSQESSPLKSTSRSLAVAAIVILIGVGAASAFAVGFSGSLEESLANPASAPAVRIAALERMRDALGYDGFLKTYRAVADGDTSARPALQREAADANSALASLRSAGEDANDATQAGAIAPFVARFVRAAHNVSAGNDAPQFSVLEQNYVALRALIGEALESARYHRTAMLSRALGVAQTLAITALSLLSLTLLGLAWFLRSRLLDPLRALRFSAERAADGGMSRQVWGIDRSDEIGALARAVNRMRRQLASGSEIEGSIASEMRAVLDNRPLEAQPENSVATVARDTVAVAARDLEMRLEEILGAVSGVRDRIEAASQDAAMASKTALEAVDLAREGAAQLASKAEHTIVNTSAQARSTLAGLTASVSRLNEAVARLEQNNLPFDDYEQPRHRESHRSSYRDDERPTYRDYERQGHREPRHEEEPRRAARDTRPLPDQAPAYREAPRRNYGDAAPREKPMTLRDVVPEIGRDRWSWGRSRKDREPMRPSKERPSGDKDSNLLGLRARVSRIDADPRDREIERQPDARHEPILGGLNHDLDRIERMASTSGLSPDEASELTASLIEAIDRLNGVAERVAEVSDRNSRSRRY